MNFIGLDTHKKTISYFLKDAAGEVLAGGTIPATRVHLEGWMKTLAAPWTVAMEATMFTGWIYDHLLPRFSGEGGAPVDAAGDRLLRRRRTIASMPARSPTACGATFCPSATWLRQTFGSAAGHSATAAAGAAERAAAQQGLADRDLATVDQDVKNLNQLRGTAF
jgi:hypothetical protein